MAGRTRRTGLQAPISARFRRAEIGVRIPARIFHESLAPTADMAALPGVLGCRSLQRTTQVRLGINPAVPRDGCPVARPSSQSRDID